MAIYNFSGMVGNVHTIALLERMLSNGSYPRFSIFSGGFGTGKSTSARIVAMALTCDNPDGGNPCGVCSVCRANQKALETTGESAFVKVVNLGILVNKTEMNKLIKDVFVLQSGEKPRVYVFEEAHVLKGLHGAQTALLEEIDRMPRNTYLIMCTTRVYDIIPELVSRAMAFRFHKLSKEEGRFLVQRVSKGQLSPEVESMVVKYSGGVPRDIIKNTEFILTNDISMDEYREYVSEISNGYFVLLFQSMQDKSALGFAGMLEELFGTRTVEEVMRALKEFLLDALFAFEGAQTALSEQELEDLRGVLDVQILNKALVLLDRGIYGMQEADLKMLLCRVRLLVQNRTVQDVVAEVPKVAAIEKERAKAETGVLHRLSENADAKALLHPITLRSFDVGDD